MLQREASRNLRGKQCPANVTVARRAGIHGIPQTPVTWLHTHTCHTGAEVHVTIIYPCGCHGNGFYQAAVAQGSRGEGAALAMTRHRVAGVRGQHAA